MTTYWVRASMGNDGNTGLSPAQAWLTVDKAANEVAAADTVYIGAGTYPEAVTMDTAGTSGNVISFIGDITGVYTGDAGPVIISGHASLTTAAAHIPLTCTLQFIEWHNVIFNGANTSACILMSPAVSATAFEGLLFQDCTILGGHAPGTSAVSASILAGVTPATPGLTFRRCVLLGSFQMKSQNTAVAHINLKWAFESCLFIGHPYALYGAKECVHLYLDGGGNTYSVGGIDFINCTFMAFEYAIEGYQVLKNTANPVRILNCAFMCGYRGMREYQCTTNAMYQANNIGWAIDALVEGDVQDGGGSDSSVSGPVIGGLCDLMFYNVLGWSPWKPWEPMSMADGTALTPLIDAASATFAPADDIYANPRPMGRNADDVGHVEARSRGQDETGTVRTGSHSTALKGAGYHDMHLPVDAALTTVSVYARYDGNYTGSLPKLEILEIPGVADQSDIQTGASGSWELLSCAFTPTSAGYVRVRLLSQDTSADGEAFFDDLGVV